MRAYDVDLGFGAASPTTVITDQFFAEPIVGGRLEMDIYDEFTIDVQTSLGWMPGDREAMSWDIEVGFVWRPVKHVGLQFGYRNLWFDLNSDNGSFEFDGGSAGLFAGLQVRF